MSKLAASMVIQKELSDLGTITAQDTQEAGLFEGCSLITLSLIIDSTTSSILALRWYEMGGGGTVIGFTVSLV